MENMHFSDSDRAARDSMTLDTQGRAEARLRALLSVAHSFIWQTNSDGYMLEESQGWQHFTGQSRDESRGMGWLNAIRPEEKAPFLQKLLQVTQMTEYSETICAIRHHNGQFRRCRIRLIPVFDDAHRVIEWLYWGRDITERQQIQAQLQHQADVIQLQSSLLELAHDAIIVRKLSGEIISWNRGAEQLYGWREEEVSGLISHALLDTEFPVSLSALEQKIALEGRWDGELVHRRRDRTQIIVESRQVLIRDVDAKPYAVLEINRDITERKQSEQASVVRMRLAVEAADVGTWDWDLLNDELIWSAQCKILFGLSAETKVSYPLFLNILHPDDRERTDNTVRRCLETKEEYDIEYRVCWPDNTIHWLAARGKVLTDGLGHSIRMLGVAIDVTLKREWEERTQRTLEALLLMAQIVVEGKPAAVSTAVPERGTNTHDLYSVSHQLASLACSVLGGRRLGIVTVESTTGRLLPVAVTGLPPEQEAGWWESIPRYTLYDGWKPEQLARLQGDEVLLLDQTDLPPVLQVALHNWLARKVLCAPMRVGEQFIGTLTLDYGIEEHRYTVQEISLASAAARLVALALERRRLMLEYAYAQANVLALQETNERMSEFIGIAGHELRTPLTTIKASVQLMQKQIMRLRQQEQKTVEHVEKVLDALQYVLSRSEHQINIQSRLINDLLDCSRIHMEHFMLNMQQHDLLTLVQGVVEEHRALTPQRVLNLHINMSKLLWVYADAERILQVLSNYLSNALKYSYPNQPVNVVVEQVGASVRVAVQDHGPGLTAEQQEHLWERFYRVPGVEVRAGSGIGLGLGLYMCRMIIEMHNGHIGVESKPGYGSTFWFTLPLAE